MADDTDKADKKPAFTAAQRKQYVEGLNTELETLKRRQDSDTKTRRIGEVEAELKKYSDRPGRGAGRQTAAE
jgi:hypothetical protein